MTLRDYLTITRRRWPIILLCAVVAGAVTWFITPRTDQRGRCGTVVHGDGDAPGGSPLP